MPLPQPEQQVPQEPSPPSAPSGFPSAADRRRSLSPSFVGQHSASPSAPASGEPHEDMASALAAAESALSSVMRLAEMYGRSPLASREASIAHSPAPGGSPLASRGTSIVHSPAPGRSPRASRGDGAARSASSSLAGAVAQLLADEGGVMADAGQAEQVCLFG